MNFGENFAFKKAVESEKYCNTNEYGIATREGIGKKTILLLGIALLTSLFIIGIMLKIGYLPLFIYPIAIIFTTVVQVIMCFSPRKAKSLAIPYAISEGLTIGVLCGLLEIVLPDQGLAIAGSALIITLSVFIVGVILYSKGFIRVGKRFYTFLICISVGLSISFLFMLIINIVSLFTGGSSFFDLLYSSPFALLIAIVMCVIASLYLIASIANANNMIRYGADANLEWYAAYAISLNVIYLFLEVLRLILILFSKNRD